MDLANAIIQHEHREPSILDDPISFKIPNPKPPPSTIPFLPAMDLAVDIPTNDLSKVDIYIDDFIIITPDLLNNCDQTNAAMPLAIRTIFCSTNTYDPIPKNNIIVRKKLQAEKTLEESKTILGWTIDT